MMQIPVDVAELLRDGQSNAEVSRRTGIHPIKIGDARRALRLPDHRDMRAGYIAPPSHRDHGSRAKYVIEKCRCKACKQANRQAHAERDRLLAYGRWQPYVDAAPVRAHIRYLQSCGMGLRALAAAADVDRKRLQAILSGRPERGTGPQEKVRPALAAAVLGVEPTLETLAPSTLISPIGTRRRVQALVAAGWPQQYLAVYLGLSPSNFGAMLDREHVLVRRALAVRAMYDALWKTDPANHGATAAGITRARKHAAEHRWAPVGAWDDDRLDDPEAFPDWTGHCGTPAGYAEHRRQKLPLCQPCKDAHTAASTVLPGVA
ncbi:hypothetical protein AB0N17_03315 [Streptomyces sp. NPDC051133]|uniref:hypothetical protein n=1 Tax=Streptomyces sp. NPDC051133 TaxID=3155521 RepID=UPI003440470B